MFERTKAILSKVNYIFDRRVKIGLVVLFFVMFLGGVFELLGVSILIPLISVIVDENSMTDTWWGKLICGVFKIYEYKFFVCFLFLCVIILYFIKNMYIILMYKLLYRFTYANKRKLAMKLFRSYMYREYEFHLNMNVSEIQRDIDVDTGQFYGLVSDVMSLGNELIIVVFLGVYLLATDWKITTLVFVLLGAALLFFFKIMKRVQIERGRENRIASAQIYKWMLQAFNGIKDTKILCREVFFIREFDTNYQRAQNANKRSNLAAVYPKPIMETLCVSVLLFVVGVRVMMSAEMENFLPIIAVFAVAAFKLLPSFNKISSYLATILFAKDSVDALYNDIIEAEKHSVKEELINNETITFNHSIEIQNVTFRYQSSNEPILNSASLSIIKNHSVALIGESGAGKSTLADVLLGLLVPQEGSILVDGKDIYSNLRGWHRIIGYIPQSIYLLDDTIRNNVAYGLDKKDINDKAVWKALKAAQMYDFVKSLPEGLDTLVGERGTRISGGQRQRIGIARALYIDPQILLFDEATSALDSETEYELMDAIGGLKGEKTMIIIAHRLNTIKDCDEVYEVKDGKIIYRIKEDVVR